MRLIVVPFVAQTELLCGGAAMEMAAAYWGDRTLRSSDFQHLVNETAGGITTDALAETVGDRGWVTIPIDGLADLRNELGRGRPIVVLVEVGPGRFHYVTVVGWIDERIVYHDPADGPYQTRTRETFDRAWSAAGRWGVSVVPGPSKSASPNTAKPETTIEAPAQSSDALASLADACTPVVELAITEAREGRVVAALRLLEGARASCPRSALVLRELAAVQLLAQKPATAAAHARESLALRDDPHTANLLGAAEYLSGDTDAALDAWSMADDPTIDRRWLVTLNRTRAQRVLGQVGLASGDGLNRARLTAARRRVRHLPTVDNARIDYRPVSPGVVDLEVAVVDAPQWPLSLGALLRSGVTATTNSEVQIEAASLSAMDERWTLSGRWSDVRPKVAFSLEIPGVAYGVWHLEASTERASFGNPSGPDLTDTRRRASIGFSTWLTPVARSRLYVSIERWRERGTGAAFGIQQTIAPLGDRLRLDLGLEGWRGIAEPFARFDALAKWRTAPASLSLDTRVGASVATSGSPRMLWPVAGNHGDAPVLARARGYRVRDVVVGPLHGRRLAHAGVEGAVRLLSFGPVEIRSAGFVDAAAVGGRPAATDQPGYHVDAGFGLRVRAPGLRLLRMDVARGLVDGRTAVSIGLVADWWEGG